jgi:hypothetical protein
MRPLARVVQAILRFLESDLEIDCATRSRKKTTFFAVSIAWSSDAPEGCVVPWFLGHRTELPSILRGIPSTREPSA